jgi:hypothetical protein
MVELNILYYVIIRVDFNDYSGRGVAHIYDAGRSYDENVTNTYTPTHTHARTHAHGGVHGVGGEEVVQLVQRKSSSGIIMGRKLIILN